MHAARTPSASRPTSGRPLHSTALGKSILAYLSDGRVCEIADRHGLAAVTEKTPTDLEELRGELAAVRERRYALDDEEHRSGLRYVAAVVLSDDDRPLGAISVAGSANRLHGERFEDELPRTLRGKLT